MRPVDFIESTSPTIVLGRDRRFDSSLSAELTADRPREFDQGTTSEKSIEVGFVRLEHHLKHPSELIKASVPLLRELNTLLSICLV